MCPSGNSFQQAQEKVEKRGTFKASGITPYEPSELYNALDTIVALEESITKDASFFQAKICFIFSRPTAARLAQLGERRSAEREAVGSNPGRTNTQGL